MCFAASSAVMFGGTMLCIYPRPVHAGGQAVATTELKVPTLEVDGVRWSASTTPQKQTDQTGAPPPVLMQPAHLPTIDVHASNVNERVETTEVVASVLISRVPNLLSRVPMPVRRPDAAWSQTISITLQPGETRIITLHPDVQLPAMSTAVFKMKAGEQEVDLLTISNSKPMPPFLDSPTTEPSKVVASTDVKK